MKVVAKTHCGRVRPINEDRYLVPEEGDSIVLVADGMGGHKAGEVASETAAQTIRACAVKMHGREISIKTALKWVRQANQIIYRMANEKPECMGMGTTMTLLWEGERRILIGHVGDSRAYRLRDGKLSQITQDHSVVGELLRNQVITPEMAKKHPYRNIITRAVGIDPVVEVDVLSEDKQLDDLWLVCSDGLYNMVDDQDIEEILQTMNEEKAADRLLELALEHGGTDNITFVLGRVMEVQGE